MFNDFNRQGQRHNRTSDETESVNGEPIYSDDGSEHSFRRARMKTTHI